MFNGQYSITILTGASAPDGSSLVAGKAFHDFDIQGGSVANLLTHSLNKMVAGVFIVAETDNQNAVLRYEYDPTVVTNSMNIYNDSSVNFKATIFVLYFI